MTDEEDDRSTTDQSTTTITSVTVVAPDGTTQEFNSAKDEEATFIQATKDAAAAKVAEYQE